MPYKSIEDQVAANKRYRERRKAKAEKVDELAQKENEFLKIVQDFIEERKILEEENRNLNNDFVAAVSLFMDAVELSGKKMSYVVSPRIREIMNLLDEFKQKLRLKEEKIVA